MQRYSDTMNFAATENGNAAQPVHVIHMYRLCRKELVPVYFRTAGSGSVVCTVKVKATITMLHD